MRSSWAQDTVLSGGEEVTHPYLKTMGALGEEQRASWVRGSEASFRKLGCFGPACSSFGSVRAAILATLSH